MASEIVLKIAPVGVDVAVNTIQAAIYKARVTNGNWDGYKSYHRAYRNETSKGVRPEVFIGKENEYRDVFMDDDFTVTSFFLTAPSTPVNDGMHTSDISIIFQVNLEKLYIEAPERFDEEFKSEIVNVLTGLGGQFDYVDTLTDLDDVYAGLDTSEVQWDNMQKFHVVRFELTANYMHSCGAEFAVAPVGVCDLSLTVLTVDETLLGANDGRAFAVPCDELGSMSYLWTTSNGSIPVGTETNQNISGLSDGLYTVTGTDDGALNCVKQASGTVAEGPPLAACNLIIVSVVNTPPSTFGATDGTATVTISGNAGPVSIRWNDGQTDATAEGLGSGPVCVSVDELSIVGCHRSGETNLAEGLKKPTDISELVVYVDFPDTATITDSGGAISLVINKGSEGDAIQTVSVLKPTTNSVTIDGHNAGDFDGGDSLKILNLTLSGKYTIIVISETDNDMIVEHSSSAGSNDGMIFFGGGPGGIRRSTFKTPSANANWLGTGASFGYGRNTGIAYDYGNTDAPIGIVDTSPIGTYDVTDTLFIGSRNESSLFTNGAFGKVMIWNKALSQKELTDMYEYAKSEYPSIP